MPVRAAISVRLREHGDLFFRRAPVTLRLCDTHAQLAQHSLPYAALAVSQGLATHDIVLTTPTTAFCVRPALKGDLAWPRIVAQLRLCTLSPPGFSYVDEIGRGSFGVVYKAYETRHAPARLCAVKHVRKSQLSAQQVPLHVARRELRIVTLLPSHRHIVRTLCAFETDRSLFVVMEHVAGGTLLNRLRHSALSFAAVRLLTQQLLQALAHIHSHCVIHRDVKMDNVLLVHAQPSQPLVAKLCDFGLAVRQCSAAPELHHTNVGTRYAQPPEMVLPAHSGRKRAPYGTAADVWACGILLFALLYKRIPWISAPHEQPRVMKRMCDLSQRSKPSIQLIQTVEERLATPPLLQSLLCGLLQPCESKRLTARAALEHRLFSQHVTEPLHATRQVQQDLMAAPVSARHAFRRVVSLVRAVECFRNSALSGISNALVVL